MEIGAPQATAHRASFTEVRIRAGQTLMAQNCPITLQGKNAKKSTPEPGGQALLNMLWLPPPSHGKERGRIKYNVDVSK